MRHVFISYSHQDNDFAQLLRTELQNAGIPTWLALENIKPGEDWKGEIDDAIKNSFALIVIISPASDQSKYVTYEWALAYGFGIPIIPILYKRLDSPQKPHPRLESLQYEDFSLNRNRPWHRVVERLNEIQTEYLRKEQRDPKIEEAIQALDHWDSATIVRAAQMLGKRKVQSAIPKLDRLLDEPDSEIQLAALDALGEIGSSQAVDKLISMVDSKGEIRYAAISALGRIGDIRAEEILLRQINSDDFRIKAASIDAMQKIPSSLLKNKLFELLQKFTYDPEEIEWSEWNGETVLTSAFNALLRLITKDDTSNLIDLLRRDESLILSGAVKLLGEIRDESSLPHLLKLTRNDSSKVSKAAYQALEKFEKVAGFREKLEQLSDDKRDEYKGSINFFYQNFRLEGLLYILGVRESKVFWEVASKIAEVVNDSDYDRLIEVLQDPYHRVRASLTS